MSFFKELKEDIVQSVNELSESLEESVANTDIEESETLEKEVQQEMDSILEDENLLLDVPDMEEALEPYSTEADAEAPAGDAAAGSGQPDDAEKAASKVPQEDETKSDKKQEVVGKMEENMASDQKEMETSAMAGTEGQSAAGEMYNSEETTVITKGTTINGGIKSDTSLIVKGVIEGDVECQGKLTVTGRVAGNSTASEIYVNTPRLNGNLVSKGSVKVDVGTVVIGNISSASVVVAGAVKGDIDVNGPIVVDSTAVVQGSIIGKSIQINSGAVIDGMCSLQYADVDLESFFD